MKEQFFKGGVANLAAMPADQLPKLVAHIKTQKGCEQLDDARLISVCSHCEAALIKLGQLGEQTTESRKIAHDELVAAGTYDAATLDLIFAEDGKILTQFTKGIFSIQNSSTIDELRESYGHTKAQWDEKIKPLKSTGGANGAPGTSQIAAHALAILTATAGTELDAAVKYFQDAGITPIKTEVIGGVEVQVEGGQVPPSNTPEATDTVVTEPEPAKPEIVNPIQEVDGKNVDTRTVAGGEVLQLALHMCGAILKGNQRTGKMLEQMGQAMAQEAEEQYNALENLRQSLGLPAPSNEAVKQIEQPVAA